VHVDADVLAEDAAAGRGHLEGGPALHPAQLRRMACEASVTAIVERNGEPLAQGRARRLATKAQRRALLARDGGCARPGCTETRIERLHAHHLRQWWFGGRTDVSNLVLLCDVDHGLVHDEDLVMTRRRGRLVVSTPGGQRIWGSADAAFAGGSRPARQTGQDGGPATGPDPFIGVHPLDQRPGRRPEEATVLPLRLHPAGDVDPLPAALLTDLPAATLPAGLGGDGERMQLGHVVWALLAHRDFLRRQAA
jgi:Domain of unknown function (DUF222)/HNH endonuclease